MTATMPRTITSVEEGTAARKAIEERRTEIMKNIFEKREMLMVDGKPNRPAVLDFYDNLITFHRLNMEFVKIIYQEREITEGVEFIRKDKEMMTLSLNISAGIMEALVSIRKSYWAMTSFEAFMGLSGQLEMALNSPGMYFRVMASLTSAMKALGEKAKANAEAQIKQPSKPVDTLVGDELLNDLKKEGLLH